MSFTKGPWEVHGFSPSRHPETYHYFLTAAGQKNDQAKANARLISAAPDMYEALKLVLSDNRLMNSMKKEQARAILDAITKAEGKL